MTLIIPGVQVRVVKEVVPPQLSPSGILGLVGPTERTPGVARASSWAAFRDQFGAATAWCLPEARQALENGVSELVVVPLDPVGKPAVATFKLSRSGGGTDTLKLTARAAGKWAEGLEVRLIPRGTGETTRVFDLEIQRPGGTDKEVLRDLTFEGGKERSADKILDSASTIARIADARDLPADAAVKTVGADGAANVLTATFAGGADADADAWLAGIDKLADHADVDMVLAAVPAWADSALFSKVHAAVIAHCQRLSGESKGRIGFGQVPQSAVTAEQIKLVGTLVSDRFVLVAPHGVVGAVAGMVGNLAYYESPTFKTVVGLGKPARDYGVEDQKALLKSSLCPVVQYRGRGVIVLRGLTTDGDQISVRRVADRAVRGVQMIGELFIGRLNSEDGRSSLKQKLTGFLLQMQKDGAIVPSTDGSDPAFKLDVYSSQDDFAKGIVRVDMAVRPVRAIDFIYATVLVQV